jgi:hypothetical protein
MRRHLEEIEQRIDVAVKMKEQTEANAKMKAFLASAVCNCGSVCVDETLSCIKCSRWLHTKCVQEQVSDSIPYFDVFIMNVYLFRAGM